MCEGAGRGEAGSGNQFSGAAMSRQPKKRFVLLGFCGCMPRSGRYAAVGVDRYIAILRRMLLSGGLPIPSY